MKPPKTPPSDDKPTIESVLDASIETLSIGISFIRKEITKIASGKAAESKHDDGSRIAFLTARVGAIADSIRKVENARAKRFDDLTPTVVLEYLRRIDASERQQIIREAIALDERKSGLA